MSRTEVPGAAIHLSDGHTLEVFPNDTRGTEEWRLLGPGEDTDHVVVEGCRVAVRALLDDAVSNGLSRAGVSQVDVGRIGGRVVGDLSR